MRAKEEVSNLTDYLKQHWATILLILGTVLLLLFSIASFNASDPEYETEDRITGVVTGLAALALLGVLFVRYRRTTRT